MQQLLRPKCLQLDTGHYNFNLFANFRVLAIFQTHKQFRSYLCIRCTLLLLDRQILGPAGVDALTSSPVGYLTKMRQWSASLPYTQIKALHCPFHAYSLQDPNSSRAVRASPSFPRARFIHSLPLVVQHNTLSN